jgi:hypothetical protein
MNRFFLVLSLALPMCGETIFQTGFEPTAYTLGALEGQNGWTGNGGGVVENSLVFQGSQAVIYDTSAAAGQYVDTMPVSYDSTTDPNYLVTVSDDFISRGLRTKPGILSPFLETAVFWVRSR